MAGVGCSLRVLVRVEDPVRRTFRNAATGLLRIPLVANAFIGRDLRDDFESPAITSAADGH